MPESARQNHSGFPTTHWSHVARAAGSSGTTACAELGGLLERYLPALRAHLVHGRRLQPALADDVLQGFVASKIIEQGLLGSADPTRGRFRSFLLTSLDRFFIDRLRHEAVRTRHHSVGAGRGSDDGVSDLPDDSPPPDHAFNVEWARRVIDEAMQLTRERLFANGRQDVWAVFEWRVIRPIFDGVPPPPYKDFVGQFQFRTATDACTAIVNARRTFARSLRDVIGQYVSDDAAIDAEILDLRQILAASR